VPSINETSCEEFIEISKRESEDRMNGWNEWRECRREPEYFACLCLTFNDQFLRAYGLKL